MRCLNEPELVFAIDGDLVPAGLTADPCGVPLSLGLASPSGMSTEAASHPFT